MKIIRGTDAITVAHPVFCWFGQPGIGKTSLGYSTKDPLLLDFDSGAHRAANRRDTLQITNWADVVELMENRAVLEPYATVVVDTVGRCLDLMTAAIIAETPKMGPGGNLSMQGWGVLKNRFRLWMSSLRALGLDVALIAHDKEDKDGDTRVVRPDIAGGSYGEIMKIADFVAYVYMAGKERVIDFNPTDRWVGKNPASWAPFRLPAVNKSQDFMAGLFQQGRDALGSISESSALLAQQGEVWRAKIAALTTAPGLNEQIPLIKALGPTLQPQVAKLLMDRGVELQATFDRSLKAFIVHEPVGLLG